MPSAHGSTSWQRKKLRPRFPSAQTNGKVMLPILKSLAKRQQVYDDYLTRAHIQTLLRQYHAQKKICSWLLYHYERKKEARLSSATGNKRKGNHAIRRRYLTFGTSSRIIHSLLYSPTLLIRQNISCLLLEATHPHLSRPFSYESRDFLIELLWDAIQHDVQSILSSSIDPNNSMQGLIQIYGMLSHLICDSDIYENMYPNSNSAGDDRNKPNWSILVFVAKGGLRWVTSSILSLVCLMLERDQQSVLAESQLDINNEDQRFSEKLEDARQYTQCVNDLNRMEAIQTRLILLIEFCHRLTMFSTLYPLEVTRHDENQQVQKQQNTTVSSLESRERSKTLCRTLPQKKGKKEKKKQDAISQSKADEYLQSFLSSSSPLIYAKKSCSSQADRQSDRRYVLEKVHKVLWTSKIPSLYTLSQVSPSLPMALETETIEEKNNRPTTTTIASPLSPLACLIAATKVLECITLHYSSSTQFSSTSRDFPFNNATAALFSSNGILTISSSSNTNTGGVLNRSIVGDGAMNKDYGPMTTSDYPFLPTRLRGMEKTLTILQKMVNPIGQLVTVLACPSTKANIDASLQESASTKIEQERVAEGKEEEYEQGFKEISLRGQRPRSFSETRKSKTSRKPCVSGISIGEKLPRKRVTDSLHTSIERLNNRKKRRLSSREDKRKSSSSGNENKIGSTALIDDTSGVHDVPSATGYSSAAEVAAVISATNISDPISFLERQNRPRTRNESDNKNCDDVVNDDANFHLESEELRMKDSEDENVQEQCLEADEYDDEGECFNDCFDDCADGDLIDEDQCEESYEVHEVDDAMMICDDIREDQGDVGPEIEREKNNSDQTQTKVLASNNERNIKAFIHASMEILLGQYPIIRHQMSACITTPAMMVINPPLLNPYAEQHLIQSLCDIVKPPKKPIKLKIFMKRAPTQEEFFRGSLSKNPVALSALKESTNHENSNDNDDEDYEPRVADLRQHIAKDLQMSDSAELLELLVANKILDMNLKLRVVHQVLWKEHVLENSNSLSESGNTTGRHIISTGTGLSMIFGTEDRITVSRAKSKNPSTLPPMVVTYRLAGVDGEATEDNVEEGDLIDPEAPSNVSTSSEDYHKQLENEFGLTRFIAKDRGVHVLLKSLESYIGNIMRRIRRDDVGLRKGTKNPSRSFFIKSPPCPALILMKYCSRLRENRKRMLEAQAPTILLRLLLDVLNSIDTSSVDENRHSCVGNNPSVDALQELIETLSSDISSVGVKCSKQGDEIEDSEPDVDGQSTLPMLLTSIQTTSMSQHLRKVIAKLLPFLTYGQLSPSRALATNFIRHIKVNSVALSCYENNDENCSLLMDTFIETAINLPPINVCEQFRTELLQQGFISQVKKFLLKEIPLAPPPWSPALAFTNNKRKDEMRNNVIDKECLQKWRQYYSRNGIQTAFRILTGLCSGHSGIQSEIADINRTEIENCGGVPTLTLIHWIESTSDNTSFNIKTNGLGILAETLLDALLKNNDDVKCKISTLRKDTRNRKKQIAEEKRRSTLMSMRILKPTTMQKPLERKFGTNQVTNVTENKGMDSLPFTKACLSQDVKTATEPNSKPAWMLEMEEMEDENGLTCSVCQEGQTLQPSQILGLYAYMKKISLLPSQAGIQRNIDGTLLLISFPSDIPASITGTEIDNEWFQPAKRLSDALKGISQTSMATPSNSRHSSYITTVTAGNAIHYSCHARARSADRNHQKAPKSEWEGASLRNSRVSCNVIFPLISKSSRLPTMSVETALADYQTAITNLLGTRPKSMLWTVLHDIRFLLLRISYGETLSADCGGGSLSSNAALIFYSFCTAGVLAKDDAQDTIQHVKELSSSLLAASAVLKIEGFVNEVVNSNNFLVGYADAAPMAAITCILFHYKSSDISVNTPEQNKSRWELHKELFLSALLYCAGRRHALGIEGSGCESAAVSGKRSNSFHEWKLDNTETGTLQREGSMLSIDSFATLLRPMITLYAIIDQISKDFTPTMSDEMIACGAGNLVRKVESLQQAENIQSLISSAKITLSEEKIIHEIKSGMETV